MLLSWVISRTKLPAWSVEVNTPASIEVNFLMGTYRAGINLWDHCNCAFCLLTWHEGSSSVLSRASQQRPLRLWHQHFIHMRDLMPLIQYFCLSSMMAAKQRSLWSHCLSSFHIWDWCTDSHPSGIYLLSGKGAKRHRLTQGRTTEVLPTLHTGLLHQVLEIIFSLDSCCCMVDSLNFHKKKKVQRPCNCQRQVRKCAAKRLKESECKWEPMWCAAQTWFSQFSGFSGAREPIVLMLSAEMMEVVLWSPLTCWRCCCSQAWFSGLPWPQL